MMQETLAQQRRREWHTLNPRDIQLYMDFWQLLRRDGFTEFTSDTFRTYGLHRSLNDPSHDIGSLFAKWKWNGLIIEKNRVRSRIKSNHSRKISVYKMKTPVEGKQ